MKKIVIGITDCFRYSSYERWILEDHELEVVQLSYRENSFNSIEKCHGILLTGGEDIDPKFYNKPEYRPFCMIENIDAQRDEFELKVLEYSQKNQLPVLGICRGLQIANVYFGGSLIHDIPLSGKPDHSKISEGNDRYHPVVVEENTLLQKIIDKGKDEINSAHHQSADHVAKELRINATSPDGIIEGLEREDSNGKSFLLLVQWHPERMTNQQSAFSKKIKESFLNATRHS